MTVEFLEPAAGGCVACHVDVPRPGKPWCSKRCRSALRAWGRTDYPSLGASEQLALVISRGEQRLRAGAGLHERVAAFLSQPRRTVTTHHEHAGRTEATAQGPTHPTSSTPGAKPTEASPALSTADGGVSVTAAAPSAAPSVGATS